MCLDIVNIIENVDVNNESMELLLNENPYIIVISSLISGVVSYIISSLKLRKTTKYNYYNKLFEMYNNICNEIIDVILPLLSIPLVNTNQISGDSQKEIMSKLTRLLYKYYNYLPEGVILSIVCLHCCLKNKSEYPYIYVKERGQYVIKSCTRKKQFLLLLNKTAIDNYMKRRKDENFRYRIKQSFKYAKSGKYSFGKRILRFCNALKHNIPVEKYPPNFIMNIQARYVIMSIDRYFGSNHLLNWSNKMKKHTLAK